MRSNHCFKDAALLMALILVNMFSLSQVALSATLDVPSTYSSIASAITAAANGDTILVASGTYSENIDFGGKNITIQSVSGAANTTIQGTGAATAVVSFISGETSSAILDGFTIDNSNNGSATSRGISITNSSAPTIKNSTLKGNQVAMYASGGAIYINAATATIQDCIIGDSTNKNQADEGAGIYATHLSAALSISGTTFIDNYVDDRGGAILLENSTSAAMTITNSTFSSNDAAYGGAIALNGNTGQTTTIGGTTNFTANTSSQHGGAIDSTGSPISVIGGSFTTNDATYDGGVFYLRDSGATLSIDGSTITNNEGRSGSVICGLISGPITIINSTIDSNNSTSYSTIYMISASGTSTISNTSISDNTSVASGGAIYFKSTTSATLSLDTVTIERNQVTNTASYDGGGLYLNGSGVTANITNSTIIDNTARSGGGVYATGIAALSLNNTNVNSNEAMNGYAGGIYIINIIGSTNISNLSISNNLSVAGGAGIYFNTASSVNFNLTNVTLSNNTHSATNHDGGNIYLKGANTTATITGCTITDSSTRSGGGIYARDTINLTIGSTTINDNTALAYGGGINMATSGATLNMTACYVQGNNAQSGGAGLYLAAGVNSTITNCLITGNRLHTYDWRYGGGISNQGTLTLTNSTLVGNYAKREGGGLYANGTETIVNSIIYGNTVTLGSSNTIYRTAEAVTYSDVEGGYTGTGNINTDPAFVSLLQATSTSATSAGDFHLSTGSTLLVDAGTTSGAPTDDIDGGTRVANPDIGADEYGAGSNNAPTLTWTGETDYVTDGVNPDSASSNTTFVFRITYTDSENDIPTSMQTWVDEDDDNIYQSDEKFNMTAVDGGDTTYTDGKLYTKTLTLVSAGDNNFSYRFYASDGTSDSIGDPTSDSAVIVLPTATTVGTATATAASDTSIGISMPYTDDNNIDNTYTVNYKLSSAGTWTNWTTGASHSATPYTTTINNLTTGESYDISMTYIDGDGVVGTPTQTVANIVLPNYATSVGTATAVDSGATTIDVSMPYTEDGNSDNTYTVDYKLSSSGTWINWVTESANTTSPYTTTITGLTTSESYDIQITYNDTDGVTGTNPQTITGITPSAPSFTVTKTTDTNDGTCDTDCSLREAITAANASSDTNVIDFSVNGTFTITGSAGEDINASGDFDLVYPVTITGNGAANTIISGGGIDRIFHLQSTAAGSQIDNVAIQNGEASTLNGGGILSDGGITITGSTITNCSANYGGAISTAGATLTNVTISTNNADVRGGAIYNITALLTINGTNNTISSNKLNNGTQSTDFGGAIYSDANVTISNTTMSGDNNTAYDAYNGGAIYMNGTTHTLNITNSTIKDFYSHLKAGAIYMTGGTLTDVTFSNNRSLTWGGAIVNTTNPLTINGTTNTFTANYASAGTAISDLGGHIYSDANLTISNTTFTGRTSTSLDAYRGGAIFMNGTTHTLNITNSSFNDFYANNQGGAIYMSGGTFTDVDFTNNISNARGGAIVNTSNPLTIKVTSGTNSFSNNYSTNGTATSDLGGHIYSDADLTIENTVFTGRGTTNLDAYWGGAIFMGGTTHTLNISDSTFDQFYAYRRGGAVYMTGGTLTDVDFTNNVSGAWGGAIVNTSNPLTIKVTSGTNSFSNNYSTNGTATSDLGGHIYSDADLTIENTVFTGRGTTNLDAYWGGAIFMGGTTHTLNISDSTFDQFYAYRRGGAVYMTGGTLTDVDFTNNISGAWGGAIVNTSNPLTIKVTSGTNSFSNNYSTNGTATSDVGGHIYCAADLTIENTVFTGRGNTNLDAYWGGAIFMGGTTHTLNISDSTFDQFYAYRRGGAVYMTGGTLTDVDFTNNVSGAWGGAIVNTSNPLTIKVTSGTNSFSNNYATNGTATSDLGGSIYSDAALSVANSTFTGRADTSLDAYYGGAIFMTGAATNLEVSTSTFKDFNSKHNGGAIYMQVGSIETSTFSNNNSNKDGGAVYSLGAGVNFLNSTFSGNNANSDGGAIYSNSSSTIKNSTFNNNTATTTADAIRGATSTIYNSIITKDTPSTHMCSGVTSGDYNLQYDGTCFTAQANDLTSSPLLYALGNNGGSTLTFSMQSSSPAIDSGNNATCLTVDQRGETRPFDYDDDLTATCDMGAIELRPVVANGTTTDTATAVAVDDSSININMPYIDDDNANNTYTIKYKLSSSGTYLDWGTNPKAHSTTPYTDTITGLTPGETYDVQLTYLDDDGITGDATQTIAAITLDNYTTVAGTATTTVLSPTSIGITMPYTGDDNANNTYKIEYRMQPSSVWLDWGTNPKAHSASPYLLTLSGLTSDNTYDIRMTYIDPDGVNGDYEQIITDISLVSSYGRTVCGSGGADFTTIQAAITASTDGDTITVCDGTYTENLAVWSRSITIQSEHGAAYTTIQPANTATVTILFQNGITAGSKLDGFTITGSSGTTAISARTKLTVQNCIISNNNAGSGNGAGIFSTGTDVTVIDTIFSGNQAAGGAAIYFNTGATATISGCTFTNNSASTTGGAIHFNSVTANSTITNSTINSNNASNGGGMYISNSSINITKCDIKNNTATYGAGVFINAGGAHNTNFTNCLMTGNAATNIGGAIYGNTEAILSFINCTIVDNSAVTQGGALYFHYLSNVDVRNSILWGNSSPYGDTCFNKSILTISDSVYENTGSNAFTGNAPTLAGYLSTTNPNLAADYHLQATSSSALDNANATYAPSDDIDGDSRPQGGGDDIGADEYLSGFNPVDHYSISHSGNGITCDGEPITITARDASDALFSVTTNTEITITTSPASGNWALTTGTGSLTDNGSGTATYTMPIGESSVVLDYANPTIGTYSFDVIDTDSIAESPSEDPSITFSAAGLRFYADGTTVANYNQIGLNNKTQIGGKSSNRAPNGQTLYLRAIQTNTDTMECEARVTGTTTINMGYECINPGSCTATNLVGIANGTTDMTCSSGVPSNTAIGRNDSGSTNLLPVSLYFDASGTATFTAVYCDVGQIRLHSSLTLAADPANNNPSVTLPGTSNDFTVVPFGYDIAIETTAGVANPKAPDANGSVFTKAGVDFKVSARAVLWESVDDDTTVDGIPDGHTDNTPLSNVDLSDNPTANNFGQENTMETLTISPNLIKPTTGTAGVLSVNTINGFTNGSGSTMTNYSEVGITEIQADGDGIYIDTTENSTGKSGYVGRFTPDHFIVSPNTPSFADGCLTGNFTYLDQPFDFTTNPTYTVTAVSASGNTTNNYGGDVPGGDVEDFWNLDAPTITSDYYTDQVGGSATFIAVTPGSAVFSNNTGYNGTGTLTVSSTSLLYNRPSVKLSPFDADVNLTLTIADLTDSPDNICYDLEPDGTCDPLTIANVVGTELRLGRLKLSNSFGSEMDDMPMSLIVQHYTGSKFEANTDDTCSAISIAFGSYTDELATGETCIQDIGSPGLSGEGCTAVGPAAEQFTEPPILGNFNLYLKQPGDNNDGSVQLSITCDPWLQYDWDNNPGTANTNPIGTATFGIYRGNDRIINFMEINR